MSCENCTACVTTDCEHSSNGSTCDFNCSKHCRPMQCVTCTCTLCNVTSGHCFYGCDEGWYGELCENKCSNCSVNSLSIGNCEQENGICLYGCLEGSYGPTCNETCYDKCGNMLCNQTTGACMSGCISGFKGPTCKDRIIGVDDDQVAGAVGGAFVIILWGVIVVILICFIRRRRLKEYEAFSRNKTLNSKRCSSRRQLQRQRSVSSSSTQQPDNEAEQCFEIVIPDFESYPKTCEARRLYFVRSYSDDSPMLHFHVCDQREDMELTHDCTDQYTSLQNSDDTVEPDNYTRSTEFIAMLSSYNDGNEQIGRNQRIQMTGDTAKSLTL